MDTGEHYSGGVFKDFIEANIRFILKYTKNYETIFRHKKNSHPGYCTLTK
jgi:hypothetical protein